MTLQIDQETTQSLQWIASTRGHDIEATITELIREAAAELQETLEDLKASQADFAAGRSLSLDEYRQQVEARRQSEDQQSQRAA